MCRHGNEVFLGKSYILFFCHKFSYVRLWIPFSNSRTQSRRRRSVTWARSSEIKIAHPHNISRSDSLKSHYQPSDERSQGKVTTKKKVSSSICSPIKLFLWRIPFTTEKRFFFSLCWLCNKMDHRSQNDNGVKVFHVLHIGRSGDQLVKVLLVYQSSQTLLAKLLNLIGVSFVGWSLRDLDVP